MKALVFILLISLILGSCDQAPKKEPQKKTANTQAATEIIKKDSTKEEGVLRIVPPNKENILPIEDMQNPEMQRALSSYNSGVDEYNKGNIEDALSLFKNSLEYYPENSKASHYIARIYFGRGEKGLALSYYKDAVEYDPADSVSILGIGQVYFDMGDYTRAMEYYNKAVDAGPKYGLAYYNRGTLYGMQQQFIPAVDDLNLSIKLDPNNSNAYLNRGLAYYFLKQLDAACEDWHKAADMGLEKGVEAVDFYCK